MNCYSEFPRSKMNLIIYIYMSVRMGKREVREVPKSDLYMSLRFVHYVVIFLSHRLFLGKMLH